jgi:hypothetical protein
MTTMHRAMAIGTGLRVRHFDGRVCFATGTSSGV